MKAITVVGVLLIVLGAVSLSYEGITYTSKEEVVDIGPIEASSETKEKIPLPPAVGVVALTGGIILLLVGAKRSGR